MALIPDVQKNLQGLSQDLYSFLYGETPQSELIKPANSFIISSGMILIGAALVLLLIAKK